MLWTSVYLSQARNISVPKRLTPTGVRDTKQLFLAGRAGVQLPEGTTLPVPPRLLLYGIR